MHKGRINNFYHSQTSGQLEVINKSLGDLLRSLVSEPLKSWDYKFYQAEFAYNKSTNRRTRRSPFKIVYGVNPRSPLDIASVLDLKRRYMLKMRNCLLKSKRST